MVKFAGLMLLCVTSATALAGTPEALKLKTSRGTDIDAIANYPDTPDKVPAIVIAPGQGYHMNLPIIEELAQAATRNGIAAIRFNWGYFSANPNGGEPSGDLKSEADDLQAVLLFAKSNPRIDSAQIILAGKSLGTLVSYPAFQKDTTLKALLIMTPICTERWDDNGNELAIPVPSGQKNYPELASTTRPIVIALGNADPLCSLPMLYDFLKDTRGNVMTAVVAGNHSLNLGPYNDPVFTQRNADNVDAAVRIMTHWLNAILER